MIGLRLEIGYIGGAPQLGFNPAVQFSPALNGAWYDPSDYATLTQESGATTPVTAVTQPVGRMLDKRLPIGPELIGNGGFDNATVWALSNTTISGGVLSFTGVASAQATQPGIFTAGVLYSLVLDITTATAGSLLILSGSGQQVPGATFTTPGIKTIFLIPNTTGQIFLFTGDSFNGTVNSISVKERPGNHILQATAAARPLTSARVNLLTKSEQFDGGNWSLQLATVAANTATAPDGTVTADTITTTASNSYVFLSPNSPVGQYTASFYVKGSGSVAIFLYNATDGTAPGTSSAFTLTSEWQRISFTATANGVVIQVGVGRIGGTGTATSFDVWGAQLDRGPIATRYQRINTATDYDTVGFTPYMMLDGVDDGLSTGAMTFSADMDCFIAIRRSAGNAILAYAAAGNLFAAAESGSAVAADAGSGTPTYASNGVSLNGGAVGTTRGQVFTALTAATWVVLEIRNLNLATGWATFGLGNAGAGFFINGDFGGMILAPAGDAAARTNNRKFLGNKVGLSL